MNEATKQLKDIEKEIWSPRTPEQRKILEAKKQGIILGLEEGRKEMIGRIEKLIDEFGFRNYFLDAGANPILAQRIIVRELKPELKQNLKKEMEGKQ